MTHTQAEGRLIDQNGLLLIDWPRLVDGGEPVPLDLLFVTANDPEISSTRPNYPDANQIAGGLERSGEPTRRVFLEEH